MALSESSLTRNERRRCSFSVVQQQQQQQRRLGMLSTTVQR